MKQTPKSHNRISIKTYLKSKNTKIRDNVEHKKRFLICHNGHELKKYESSQIKCHFKHKNLNDIVNNGMTIWHKEWESHFENIEINFSDEKFKTNFNVKYLKSAEVKVYKLINAGYTREELNVDDKYKDNAIKGTLGENKESNNSEQTYKTSFNYKDLKSTEDKRV